MSAAIEVVAIVAIVGYVITRQLIGEPLRGKRVVILPIVLTVIGAVDLHSDSPHIRTVDLAILVGSGVVAAGIGVAQAAMMRLESRGGALWGQLPTKALWLWALLIATRVIATLIADGMNAKAAAASSAILLMLGINRLAQAAVIIVRGTSSGITFAAEDDGKTILADLMGHPLESDPAQRFSGPDDRFASRPDGAQNREARDGAIDWVAVGRRASGYFANRRNNR